MYLAVGSPRAISLKCVFFSSGSRPLSVKHDPIWEYCHHQMVSSRNRVVFELYFKLRVVIEPQTLKPKPQHLINPRP